MDLNLRSVISNCSFDQTNEKFKYNFNRATAFLIKCNHSKTGLFKPSSPSECLNAPAPLTASSRLKYTKLDLSGLSRALMFDLGKQSDGVICLDKFEQSAWDFI